MESAAAVLAGGRYRAFVSYSHADSAFAHWLHRKLESAEDPDGARLSPVFIDRAELAAGPDLSAQVREALAESAALIVIASPAARESRWVAQEIALFQELNPDRPVLAALIAGEPDEAFPEALQSYQGRSVEPLAADFRVGHDGKRLGLLKIVAGLTGQRLDRLVQRDAQTRQRRVMAVTAATALLSLILAGLLVVAVRARNEAERQRIEAEGLVEFMLTDLRDRLKGVGSPTIMASVNERALVYYAHQQLALLSDESLDRRARVLHAMGEDLERLGKFQPAQAMYREAWRTTGEVLGRHPNDPDAIFTHAQSEYWVGEAAWQQGDLAITETHWLGYLAQAEALARAEPNSKRSLMELGYANGNLCELIARRDDDADKALPFCARASGHLRDAAKRFPNDQAVALALSNRLGWQADIELKRGNPEDTIRLRREEAVMLDGLVRLEPENSSYRERQLWPQIGIAEALLAQNKHHEAIAVLLKCLAAYDVLAERRPDDTQLTEQRMRATWMTAKAKRYLRSRDAGHWKAMTEALYRKLGNTHPPGKMARFDKMMAKLNRGDRQ